METDWTRIERPVPGLEQLLQETGTGKSPIGISPDNVEELVVLDTTDSKLEQEQKPEHDEKTNRPRKRLRSFQSNYHDDMGECYIELFNKIFIKKTASLSDYKLLYKEIPKKPNYQTMIDYLEDEIHEIENYIPWTPERILTLLSVAVFSLNMYTWFF
jgi:hypothetical protein